VSAARGQPGPLSRRYVEWALRWGKWLWLVALVVAVPAAWRTAQLYIHLRSEVEQLLPRSAPSVVAIDELRRRMPGLQYLGVVVDAPDAAALHGAERMLDDLAARVRAYPPGLVRSVRTGDAAERKFVEDHAPLYMDLPDLQTIRERVEARRDWEAARETGALLDDDTTPPPLDFDAIQKKYDDKSRETRRGGDGRYSSESQGTTLLLVQVGEFNTGGHGSGEELLNRIKADIQSLRPDAYAPGLRVGYTGDVAINVEETSALVSDLSISSVLVMVLVVAVIVLYYRWWRSVAVLLAPLLLATVLTFAIASLPPLSISSLNSNTAFLGSIIVGNGINFGIVLLARYLEERRRGGAPGEAMTTAVWGARIGTLSAALAAGASYAALAITDFRGFRQFGFIGLIGMVLCWVTAFVLMPSLATWMDRGTLPRKREGAMGAVAHLVARHRRAILVVSALLAVGAAWRVRDFGPDQIETDFSKLRRSDTWKSGEGYWGRRMDALLQTYLTPTVVLADDPEQARAIGQRLAREAKEAPLDAMVASVRTVDDVVPPDQAAKLAVVAQIREDLTPRVMASLTDEQRRMVDRVLGHGELHPLTAAEVPEAFTAGLRERDGSMDRAVLVFPRPGKATWQGAPLADFVARLRAAAGTVTAPGQKAARVAGSLPLSADILDSVRRDGALASALAFFGVVAVVLLLLRANAAKVIVTASLLLGVLWLGGAAMALGIKINFANFIAFPITFGIGVDYAVNVASRWELDGRRSIADAVRTTGGAVTLCSLTTIIGYSSLLLAENHALFLFGLLAVLGEIACLSTAILVMPAFVDWIGTLRATAAAGAEPTDQAASGRRGS
jgi:predicted RND superfamily exporter protein